MAEWQTQEKPKGLKSSTTCHDNLPRISLVVRRTALGPCQRWFEPIIRDKVPTAFKGGASGCSLVVRRQFWVLEFGSSILPTPTMEDEGSVVGHQPRKLGHL